jgi:hypothetical protein
VAVLLLLPTAAWPQADVTVIVTDDLVSVTAVAAPLWSVLGAMAGEGLIEVSAFDSLEQRIDVTAGPVPVDDLLRRLLRHHSYLYVEAPGSDRLWVLSPGDGWPEVKWAATSGEGERLGRIHVDLSDPDPDIREEAVLATAELDPGLAVNLLLPALHDRAPGVREAAAAVLDDMGESVHLARRRAEKRRTDGVQQ